MIENRLTHRDACHLARGLLQWFREDGSDR